MVCSGECYIDYSLGLVLIFVQAGASCQWTTDTQRLILESFDVIHDSPSHIYCSALKFAPPSSWFCQYYSVEVPQEIKVVRGLSSGWGTCFRTVLANADPCILTCWKETIAAGLDSGDIITLNAVTGSKIAVLSEHTGAVTSLAFLPDGTSLVSGSWDNTIKLWDMQTGGVVKTFQGHTHWVNSVSISPNCTTIVSGSNDHTICLWDIQTGECYCVLQQEDSVHSVHFFPLDPQHFISISGGKVWEWGLDGHKVGPKYNASHAAFSYDGTKLALYNRGLVQVQSSNSGAVVTKFHMENTGIGDCCFSPDGRLVAVVADHIAYVWDITNSKPCLIETLIGHSSDITSFTFSSPTSFISAAWDQSVKFWQIGTSSTSPDIADPNSIPSTSPIKSITLQARDGIAISTDSEGVVRMWDLSTGLCKALFQTPAKGSCLRDARLIDNRLALVWHADYKTHTWDVEKGELLQTVDPDLYNVQDLRISGDGSKVFYLTLHGIHAWHIWTGEVMGEVHLDSLSLYNFLTIDSSRVWVHPYIGIKGWDFGVPDSSSIKHYGEPQNRPHLDFVGGIRRYRTFLPGIEDTITGKEVFRLPLGYTIPADAQWDGQYLVAGYNTGEVLILDCSCMLAQ